MKFTINVKELEKKLTVLSKIVASNNVFPILSNFLFVVKGNDLTLTSSDSEITVITKTELADVEGEGNFTCPVKMILDLLKEVNDEYLSFEIDGNHVSMESLKGRYAFMSMDANEFPSVPSMLSVKEILVPYTTFKQGIARTIFAVSEDQLRPVVTGVYIETVGDVIGFTATDQYKISWVIGNHLLRDEVGFIISSKTANLLNTLPNKAITNVGIEVSAVNAKFEVGEYVVYARLIDGSYPPFRSVIPKGEMKTVSTSKKELLGAIKRAAVFSNSKNGIIKLSVGKALVISSNDVDDKKSSKETIACVYNGEPMDIGFNKTFLIEVISNIESDDVIMSITKPCNPILFNYEHIKLILIPLMLN